MVGKVEFAPLAEVPTITEIDEGGETHVLVSTSVEGTPRVRRVNRNTLGIRFQRDATQIVFSDGQTLSSIPLAKAMAVLSLEATQPSRFRLYGTAAARDADAARPEGTPAAADAGLMLEFIAAPGSLSRLIAPAVIVFNADDPASTTIYFTVDSATAVDITIAYIPLE